MSTTATTVYGITIEDIVQSLHRIPEERLPDILQFIEFIEYQIYAEDESLEDEALWTAVEVNQAYKNEHPDEEPERYTSGDDFLRAFSEL
jgi:hypothetical protein